jgi:putative tryptophan/tyrosine transport system substrate-binding protein
MRGMTRSLILAATFVLVIITWADAQSQTGKIPLVGILGGSTADAAKRNFDAFRDGMRELGWVEGKNVVFKYRHADGDLSRLAGFAAELVKLNVDIILAAGSQSPPRQNKQQRRYPLSPEPRGIWSAPVWCKAWRAQVAISRVPPSYLLT